MDGDEETYVGTHNLTYYTKNHEECMSVDENLTSIIKKQNCYMSIKTKYISYCDVSLYNAIEFQ